MLQKKIIDLSLPLQTNSGEPVSVEITQVGHKDGGNIFGKKFAFRKQNNIFRRLQSILLYYMGVKRLSNNSFPDAEFLNMEIVKASTHSGTHFDAPYHFGSTSEGKPALTIDLIPLDWCFNDGVVLDFTQKKPGETITLDEMQRAINKIDYNIKPDDIVLLHTGASKYWGSKQYLNAHPGLSREALLFLLEMGIRIIGIDAYGMDRPFKDMLADYFKTGNQKILFPAHFTGREKMYCHIERLANLNLLPPNGFKVACFPVNIKNSGAAWARVVAILDQ